MPESIQIVAVLTTVVCKSRENSELSKTSKMNLLEKMFKIFKNTVFPVTFILDVGINSKTSKLKLLEKTVKIFIKALTIFQSLNQEFFRAGEFSWN